MAEFIVLPITTDEELLVQDAIGYIQTAFPGWEPASEAQFEVWLIRALGRMLAEARDVAADVPPEIFRYYGKTIVKLPPIDAAPAQGATTWTMIDNAGYTIPAGTVIGIRTAGDDLHAFETLNTVVVPPGSTVTAAGEVVIQALEEGAAASGVTGAVELIDGLSFVQGITLPSPTANGVDAESNEEYNNRLSTRLQLLTPRPILPRDFAILSLDIAGVARATAIDLYDPGPPIVTNQPRCVTVALMDAAGNAVAAPTKTAVHDMLQSQREVNFLVFVIDPTFNPIDVDFAGKAYPGWDPDAVEADCIVAITDYLRGINWGLPPSGEIAEWNNKTTIEKYELGTVLNTVDGFDRITSLTFAKNPNALGTADVVMTGVAPLPVPNIITGNVTAP